jgi:penicillin amidase
MRRYLSFAAAALATIGLVYTLDSRQVLPAPLGKLLSPQHGIWQNAEPVEQSFNLTYSFPELSAPVSVYMDDRLVPHVVAQNEADLYFVQGFLHAKFRLWQMEFQTHAASGRISEILGAGPGGRILNYDRSMRRLGMVYAAEQSVKEVEKSPESLGQYEAYANGVNAYIDQLTISELPIEYKLLGYFPEKWSLLKTALFLKYMSYDLAGSESDLEFTNARSNFSQMDFEQLYYYLADSLKPVIPNTLQQPYPATPALNLDPPADVDSLYFSYLGDSAIASVILENKPNPENGSNNWAVSGAKTASGRPILSNDPHLGLNLPSLWFEMQLTTPEFSAYGVTFPGSPNVIIGFNEDISFGFTNAGRDVKDYYEIKFQDENKAAYWFNGEWKPAEKRVEIIKIKGEPDLLDTVSYTMFGPVMYDDKYKINDQTIRYLAVRWKAHDPSNDGRAFYELNHAKNLADYQEAIKYLTCPGQNCIFASKTGDIALTQQGVFPAKWRRQGDFIMRGTDSAYMWRGMIPMEENPRMINPERNYVSSANQLAADGTYPYYTGTEFPIYRGYMINRLLDSMQGIRPEDMMAMQMNDYVAKAEFARPILLRTNPASLTESGRKYLEIFRKWNLRNEPGSEGATVFDFWWQQLQHSIWDDEFAETDLPMPWPSEFTLVESLLRDSVYSFTDNINTEVKEGLEELLASSLNIASDSLDKLAAKNGLAWEKVKATGVNHLLKVIQPFNRSNLPIGGGKGVINATAADHGQSWRMVIHMTDEIEGYGIYPGGQSGNPGSKYYDNFVDDWAAGKHHRLLFMKRGETSDPKIRWTMEFRKG